MSEEGIFDIHCHIVPSVDDGAESREEAAELLRMEYAQGVRSIIVTPHYRAGMFESSPEQVQKQFRILKEEAGRIDRDLKIYLGSEFHVNMEMVEMLKKGRASTMAGSRYILAEFSGGAQISYMRERLYSLQLHGFKPIVAHIERCEFIRKHVDSVEELVNMGVLIQINADSVLGKEGFGSRRFCNKLLKSDLVHFIGSDCHGTTRRIPRIGEAYRYVLKKFGRTYAEEIFIHNPQMILEDIFR